MDQIITLKNDKQLEGYRTAGKIAAGALALLESLILGKTSLSLLELDHIAEEFIINKGAQCTFKGYRDFPNCCCVSINQNLVHGIPSDYHLQEGDIVSIDLGATVNGCVGDTALTVIYGDAKSARHTELVEATKEALNKGIEAIAVGRHIGHIGEAIYRIGKRYGFAVVETYGGHGLDTAKDGSAIPHAAPFICNKDVSENGVRIQKGLVLAIEPLFVLGNSNRTKTLDDKWTVVCDDVCSHHEDTIYVHDGYVENLTDRSWP